MSHKTPWRHGANELAEAKPGRDAQAPQHARSAAAAGAAECVRGPGSGTADL